MKITEEQVRKFLLELSEEELREIVFGLYLIKERNEADDHGSYEHLWDGVDAKDLYNQINEVLKSKKR